VSDSSELGAAAPAEACQPVASRHGLEGLLERAREGQRGATDELFTLVYAELRRLADKFLSEERPGQTLQPTALVHEAYLRLSASSAPSWESRAHFFGAAARAIRCILVDRARARRSARHGEGARARSLDTVGEIALPESRSDFLALDEALERLAHADAQKARVVELRFFAGLTVDETAAALGLSASTVARDWRFARIWLHRELTSERAR
jgi:RNA polymerase sigma factor (TIGR02999 family)